MDTIPYDDLTKGTAPVPAEAVREGIADVEAGRTVPYEAVRAWLLSWGTKDERPAPKVQGSATRP